MRGEKVYSIDELCEGVLKQQLAGSKMLQRYYGSPDDTPQAFRCLDCGGELPNSRWAYCPSCREHNRSLGGPKKTWGPGKGK